MLVVSDADYHLLPPRDVLERGHKAASIDRTPFSTHQSSTANRHRRFVVSIKLDQLYADRADTQYCVIGYCILP